MTDVKNWFDHHSTALKVLHMYNQKNIEMLLNTISRNARIFMKYGEDTEMYFNYEKNKITNVTIIQRRVSKC